MRARYVLILSLCSFCFGQSTSKSDLSGPQKALTEKEKKIFDAVKKGGLHKNARLISVDSVSLTNGVFNLDLFDGLRGSFKVTNISKEDGDILMRGSTENGEYGALETFCIRKRNEQYSGYIIHKGHDYKLIPISSKKSILVEENTRLTCGTKGISEKREKLK